MTDAIRPFQPGDLQDVLAVLTDAMPQEGIGEQRFTRQVLLDPNFRAAGMPVAVRGNRVVGFSLSIARQVPLENAASDADRGYVTLLAVAPHAQRQGVASQLLAHAEDYLRSQGRSVVMASSYAPGYFVPGVDVNLYAAALALLTKHGYVEVYRPLAMETSLWNVQTPRWVAQKREEEFDLEPFRGELALPLIEFAQREFPGDWVRVVRETAARIATGDSPRRLIVASERGEILGFSHYDNERFGPIGVAASQRGRGIGQALMFATLQAQRDAGFRVAWFLWSDDKTAERIYHAAGFRETRRFALMKKML